MLYHFLVACKSINVCVIGHVLSLIARKELANHQVCCKIRVPLCLVVKTDVTQKEEEFDRVLLRGLPGRH